MRCEKICHPLPAPQTLVLLWMQTRWSGAAYSLYRGGAALIRQAT
jgi:hypothetical protein